MGKALLFLGPQEWQRFFPSAKKITIAMAEKSHLTSMSVLSLLFFVVKGQENLPISKAFYPY